MMTAPTGTSPRRAAARARRSAASMPARSAGDGVPLRTHRLGRASSHGSGSRHARELEAAIADVHPNDVPLLVASFQQLERDRILEQPLDHPLERTGAVDRIVALVGEELA